MKKIGITDIARRAGVAPSTVSRALNHSPLISQEVRRKVLTLARTMGYQPHTKNTRVIAVLFGGPSPSGYVVEILCAVQRCAQRRSYRLELILPDALRNMNERLFYGAIAFGLPGNFLTDWRENMSLPLVKINAAGSPLDQIYSVVSDDAAAVSKAMAKFRHAGHQRIGFLLARELNHLNNIERLAAYRRQCLIHGLEPLDIICDCRLDAVEHSLRALLQKKISAMIYLAPISINLEMLLNRLKLKIPIDLSLIVWEMLGLEESYLPDYTIVRQNYDGLANSAIDILESVASRKTAPSQVYVDYTFREGNSIAVLNK